MDETSRTKSLRDRAEALLRNSPAELSEDSADTARLVHELQTHQIELELQNEELLAAQEALAETRDRYASLYDFAPVGYLTTDVQGCILSCNLKLAMILDRSRDDLVGSKLSSYLTAADADVYHHHRQEVLDAILPTSCTLQVDFEDGSPLWLEAESIICPESVDEPQIRTVLSDITTRYLMNLKNRELESRILHAQKLESLGIMASNIAHDFNNLLMAIVGNADLALGMIPGRSPAVCCLEEILKGSRRASELANEMLDYSSKDFGDLQPLGIREVLDGAAQLLDVAIPKRIVFTCQADDAIPAFDGVESKIHQIVVNLITNAAEAIGDDKGRIDLRAGSMMCEREYLDEALETLKSEEALPLPEGRYTYFEVSDTGVGMNAEVVAQIFDPFFTTKLKGRGLGMALVRGIILHHGGGLKIDTEPELGTVVRVLFPASDRAVMQPQTEPSTGETERNWNGCGTILLVDDEAAIRSVCKRMLERIGFSVITAADGQEGVAVFEKHHHEIDCVLLDMNMPRMNGDEAYTVMRTLDDSARIVICSGKSQRDTWDRYECLEHANFLQKPYDSRALQDSLFAILEGTDAVCQACPDS